LELGRRETVCECEKEGMRVIAGFYTDRERRRGTGKGPAASAHLPLMVGGLCGRQEKENEKELEEGVGAGINCLLLELKEGGEAG
jgi:hypothetical protein